MTIITAVSCNPFVAMTSDRLVTLQRGGKYAGKYNPAANKNIILRTMDSIALIGFSGAAYIDGIPTDDWIASVLLHRAPASSEMIQESADKHWRKVASAINTIVRRLEAAGQLGSVQLLFTGFRTIGGWIFPFGIRLSADGRLDGNMRRKIGYGYCAIGQLLTKEEFNDYVLVPGRNFCASRTADAEIPITELGRLVRTIASREPTVGGDTMEMAMFGSNPNIVRLSYQTSLSDTTYYTPWVISIKGVFPPTVISHGVQGEMGDGFVRVMFKGTDHPIPKGSTITVEAAPRVPAPGLGAIPKV